MKNDEDILNVLVGGTNLSFYMIAGLISIIFAKTFVHWVIIFAIAIALSMTFKITIHILIERRYRK